MACFLVPVAEAVVTTTAMKLMQKREKQHAAETAEGTALAEEIKLPFSQKLKWLNNMLWGGSALLCFEHVWHGEIVPFFPFLTAAATPAGTAEMLREMGTVGVSMAALVTLAWAGLLAVSHVIEKRTVLKADGGAVGGQMQ